MSRRHWSGVSWCPMDRCYLLLATACRRRRWLLWVVIVALLATVGVLMNLVGKRRESADVLTLDKHFVAKHDKGREQRRSNGAVESGRRLEMGQTTNSNLNQHLRHNVGVHILTSQARPATLQPPNKQSQPHAMAQSQISNVEVKLQSQKQTYENRLDIKTTTGHPLSQTKEQKQGSILDHLSKFSSLNEAAVRVHLVELPYDNSEQFVQFVRRSVGCKSRKSCCTDTLECKDCNVLQHPCRVTDAFALRNDPSVFSAILLQHPVQRVMSCFVDVSVRKSSCYLPGDITAAVANKKMNIIEFVSHHCTSNVLTRALSGDSLLPCKPAKVTQDQFEKAKALLMKMDFVGLKEYLPESAQLFQTQLKQRGFVKFVNVSAREVSRVLVSPVYGEEHRQQCLSDEENMTIYTNNQYDLQLYKLAVEIFFQQLCTAGVRCHPKFELTHAVSLDADSYYWYRSPYTTLQQIVSFLHIPKTGGSAFVRVLRQFVGCDSVCWCTGMCHSSCPYVIGQCGHNSDVPMGTCGGQPVVAAVMMRDPVARLLSNYGHAVTVKSGECCGLPRSVLDAIQKNHLSFIEFSSRDGVTNAMTRMLAGFDIYDPTVIADQKTLEKAMSQLARFAFVGLQEHYDESVKLFYKTMKSPVAPPQSAFQVLNRRGSTRELSDHDLNHIRMSNSLDMQLYSMAKKLFYKRLCEAHIACHNQNL